MGKDRNLQASLDAANNTPPKAQPPKVKSVAPPNVAKRLAPSSHKQAVTAVDVYDSFEYETAFRMAFLGAGQGGSRMANAFWNLGYRRVGCFNTTESDFEGLAEEMPKLSLDVGGAAKDANFAKEQLRGRDQEVWDLMTRTFGNTLDCALICVGLGGGTGSGTGPELVKLARKYMESKGRPARVGALVSLPPATEGQQVARNAVNAFRELLEIKASPIIVIDNARIHELYKPGMMKLHATANDTIAQLFHLFNQLGATRSQLMTFDQSEFAQLMDSGIVVMGSADIDLSGVTGPADISKAIREQTSANVLAEVDLTKGKKAACIFVGDEETLNKYGLDYFDAGFTQMDRILGSAYNGSVSTVLHRGIYVGESEGLQCYTLVADLEPPYNRLNELSRKAGLDARVVSTMASLLGVAD